MIPESMMTRRYVLRSDDRRMVAAGSTPGRLSLTVDAVHAMTFVSAIEAEDWRRGVVDARAGRLEVEGVPAWMLLGLGQRAG